MYNGDDLKDFKNLLKTKNESERGNWVKKYLKNYAIYQDKIGNLSVIKNKEKYTPTLNCHLDTVHDEYFLEIDVKKDKNVFFDIDNQIFWSPQGIGGDDLCGVFLACKIFKGYKGSLQVVFNSLEEYGGVGSSSFEFVFDPAYIITVDRKGISDIVTDISGQDLMENTLKNKVLQIAKFHGREKTTGLFSDCLNFAKKGYGSMNLSCGYYNPHSLQEYISFRDMQKTESFILDLLKNIPIKKYGSGKEKIKNRISKHPYLITNPCIFCNSKNAYYDYYYEAYICNKCLQFELIIKGGLKNDI